MPLKDRRCEIESYENCRTRKLLEACNCVPWEVSEYQVGWFKRQFCQPFPQGMQRCSPKGRDCIESNFTLTFNCSVSCEGVYADVQWVNEPFEEGEELKEDTEMIHWQQEDI